MKKTWMVLLSCFLCVVPAAHAYDFIEEKSTHFIIYYDKGV